MPSPWMSVAQGSDRGTVWLAPDEGEPRVDEAALAIEAPETQEMVEGGNSAEGGTEADGMSRTCGAFSAVTSSGSPHVPGSVK